MSYQEDRLTEIADAIRAKDGTTELIKATDLANRILDIPSGGGVELDKYYYRVVQLTLISADRLQYLDEAWDSRHQITVDASGNVTGVTGTLNDIVIPKEALVIPGSTFASSDFTGSLTLSNSVTSIGDSAFEDCSGLIGSLIIPNSVTSIGEFAFYNCSGFTGSLTLSNSVTSIGEFAFYNCSGFTGSLTLSNSVTSIGDSAFEDCSGFTGNLIIPNSVTSIGDSAFNGCSGFTGSLIISNSVTIIDSYAFGWCESLTNVVFDGQIQEIHMGAFYGCEEILEYDFTNCYSVPVLEDMGVFDFINANCIMKVPLALEASWKAATNWATYADYIVGV